MRRAARYLVGTHDFASFCAAGSSATTTERALRRLDVVGESGARVEIFFEGAGFLRQMARILAGTLLAAGSGRWLPGDMPAILAARDRRKAGPTAPAHGLTLVAVRYGLPAPRQADSGARLDSVDRSSS
jgi:tRNA pseudouridine38-40 synthase